MKNFFLTSLFLLFVTQANAQILATGTTGMAMTSYTNGAPDDPIYIWCGDNLSNSAGNLTAYAPSAGSFNFSWFYHDEATSSWAAYSTDIGSFSTISNLPSDGYRVVIRDGSNN